MSDRSETATAIVVIGIVVVLLISIVFGTLWGWAHFRLWRAEYKGKAVEIERKYEGKAILAKAEHSRKARVEAAKAEKEAAQLTADAIAIVGAAAQEFPEYRQQEFYLALGEALQEGLIDQIIYLPTEAGLPITEAGRFNRSQQAD